MQFGCYVQVASEEVEKIQEIDLCLGTNMKKDIVEIVESYIKADLDEKNYDKSNIMMDDVFKSKDYCEFGSITFSENTRAVIKVQDGCDRFCSYCLIPYARGRVRSRNPKNVIEEVKKIANKGFKEVVITGIHVASYGKDFNENDIKLFVESKNCHSNLESNKYELIDLLEEINNIEGIERVRLRFY